jgi:hypothetical protein
MSRAQQMGVFWVRFHAWLVPADVLAKVLVDTDGVLFPYSLIVLRQIRAAALNNEALRHVRSWEDVHAALTRWGEEDLDLYCLLETIVYQAVEGYFDEAKKVSFHAAYQDRAAEIIPLRR